MKPHLPILFVLALIAASAARAQEAEDTPVYDLHEFSLWGLDPTLEQANQLAHYPSAMPGVVDTDRSRTNESGKITPLSVITFHGQPVNDLEIDLRVQSGHFVGHWPPAESKSNRLRWLDLASLEQAETGALVATVDDKHWFNQARLLDALYVKDKSREERFLTYDSEFKYEQPVQVTGGPDKFLVTNSSKHPLLDLLVVVSDDDGVRTGWLESLPPAKAKSEPGAPAEKKEAVETKTDEAKPAAAATTAPAIPATGATEVPAQSVPDGNSGKTQPPRPTAPAASATPPLAASLEPTELVMSPPAARDSQEVKDIGQRLSDNLLKLGFTQREVELLLDRAAPAWPHGKEMVVLFRLPIEAVEERLPLVAYPAPRKTLRTALVVVHNLDPRIKNEVQELIAQLGADEYNAREKAEKRLTELGRLALPALKAALKSSDLEIVFRAERILLAQNEKLEGT